MCTLHHTEPHGNQTAYNPPWQWLWLLLVLMEDVSCGGGPSLWSRKPACTLLRECGPDHLPPSVQLVTVIYADSLNRSRAFKSSYEWRNWNFVKKATANFKPLTPCCIFGIKCNRLSGFFPDKVSLWKYVLPANMQQFRIYAKFKREEIILLMAYMSDFVVIEISNCFDACRESCQPFFV